MKRMRFVNILLLFFCAACLRAQSKQYVQVLEYIPDFEKIGTDAKRVPLGNVEISALGAGTVVTDRLGVCKLEFLTKNPGDELRFRRVYKSGYEMLNPVQADVHYVIHTANDTIQLVMITNENQLRRGQIFAQFAENQYNRQKEAEMARLDKNSEKYEEELRNIELDYQQKMDNIGNYVRTMSRMDFSTLTGQDKIAFDLYVKGEYEKAIEVIDNMNLIDLYRVSVQAARRLENAREKVMSAEKAHRVQRDTLRVHLYNHLSILILEGSSSSMNKAMRMLEKMLTADPLSVQAMRIYMGLCLDSKYFAFADSLIREEIQRPDLTLYQEVFLRTCVSQLLVARRRYSEARHHLSQSELKRDELIRADSADMHLWYRKMMCHQLTATCMYNNNEYDKAVRQIHKSYDAYKHLRALDEEPCIYINEAYLTLGQNIDMLIDMGEEAFADSIYEMARERVTLRLVQNTLKTRYVVLSYNIRHGDMLIQDGEFDKGYELIKQQLPELEHMYEVNPMLVDELYLRALSSLRNYYKYKVNAQKVLELSQKSEAVYYRMMEMEEEVNKHNTYGPLYGKDLTFVMNAKSLYVDIRFDCVRAWYALDPDAKPIPILGEIVDILTGLPSRSPQQEELLNECRKEIRNLEEGRSSWLSSGDVSI